MNFSKHLIETAGYVGEPRPPMAVSVHGFSTRQQRSGSQLWGNPTHISNQFDHHSIRSLRPHSHTFSSE